MLRWGDFISSRLLRSPTATVKYLRFRGRVASDVLLPEVAGIGPSGQPLYCVEDPSASRIHYFNSLTVGSFYRNGLTVRADQLARSYSLDLVPFREKDLLLDCGANVGDLHLWVVLKSEIDDIRYLGIEPGLDEFACLIRNVQGSRSTVLQVALGDRDGTAPLYYEPYGANSSLVEPSHFMSTYDVEVRRLDSLLESLEGLLEESNGCIRLVKLEAEGTEPEVVAGFGEYASRIDYVAADLGPERGKNQESTVAPVTQMLYDMGFRMISARGHRYLFVRGNLES